MTPFKQKPRKPKMVHMDMDQMQSILQTVADPFTLLAATEIVALVREGYLAPFVYDEDQVAKVLAEVYRKNSFTAERLRGMRAELLEHFFHELPDGRWEPSRKLFSESAQRMKRTRYD